MLNREILPDRLYSGEDGRPRRVIAIEGDEVLFTIRGVTSLQPIRAPIGKFAAWAKREEQGAN